MFEGKTAFLFGVALITLATCNFAPAPENAKMVTCLPGVTEEHGRLCKLRAALEGGDTLFGDWKAVGIVSQGADGNEPLCTGTLIAPRVVLTSASCVPNPQARYMFHVPAAPQTKISGNAIRHPDYIEGSASHDLAVIVLHKKMEGVTPLRPFCGYEPCRGQPLTVLGAGNGGGDGAFQDVRWGTATAIDVQGGKLQASASVLRDGDLGGPTLVPHMLISEATERGWYVVGVHSSWSSTTISDAHLAKDACDFINSTVERSSGCDSTGLAWKSGNKTNYTSYPEPGSEECIAYSGCQWAGMFAYCSGKKPEAWVAKHNIAALFPTGDLALHDLCLRSSDGKEIVVTVYDTCGDSDCGGCCTRNKGSAEALVDLESYTNQRWGVSDGPIQWADLGPTKGGGCD